MDDRDRLIVLADALALAIDRLTLAMACERPLRTPETHPDVLEAWDILEPIVSAYWAARKRMTALGDADARTRIRQSGEQGVVVEYLTPPTNQIPPHQR
jgi:hypothetical protein